MTAWVFTHANLVLSFDKFEFHLFLGANHFLEQCRVSTVLVRKRETKCVLEKMETTGSMSLWPSLLTTV